MRNGVALFEEELDLSSINGRRSRRYRARRETRGIALRLFISCWMIYALHFATNTVREIYPALSLGDHLSFDVSEYAGFHPDIFELPGRGTYINNNPGASILGAFPYVLFRPLTDRVVEGARNSRAADPAPAGEYRTIYPLAQEFYRKARERGLDVKFGLAAAITQAFCMAPLSALSVVVMFHLLLQLTSSTRQSLLLALLYAFATPVFYRTAQLNQNLLVGHCALFAFALLWRPWSLSPLFNRHRYLLAGLLCGWAVVLDYSGLVIVAGLGAYACWSRMSAPPADGRFADLARFGAGVALSVAVLIGYQWLSFGNPLYPAQTYMPPANFTDRGYRGMDWPKLDLLWETAFGMRYGLFTSAPLLLLALYFPGWWPRPQALFGRREVWCFVALVLAFFLFCAANQYGRMQFNTGVRHIVPIVPFLFLLAAGVLLRMPKMIAALVGVLATYWSWCLVMYRDVEQGAGVFESLRHVTLEGFRLPWMLTLERMGYLASGATPLPLFLLCAVVLVVLWRTGRDEGAVERFVSGDDF